MLSRPDRLVMLSRPDRLDYADMSFFNLYSFADNISNYENDNIKYRYYDDLQNIISASNSNIVNPTNSDETKEVNSNQRLNLLKPFVPSHYYRVGFDTNYSNLALTQHASPTAAGGQLIADYYSQKYQAKMTLMPSFSPDVIKLMIEKARKSKESDRHAFLIGFATYHTVTIVYIKEGSEEGILLADSLEPLTESDEIVRALMPLKIPFYNVNGKRQKDYYSCHIDGIIFSRDATRKLPDGSPAYFVPNLLSHLKQHKTLPDKLLLTAQRREFLNKNRENDSKPVHDDQVIDKFRERYTVALQRVGSGVTKMVYAYLMKKSLKSIKIMKMQHYLAQMKPFFKPDIFPIIRREYISKAKSILNTEKLPYQRAGGFFSSLSASARTKEEQFSDFHRFSCDFLFTNMNNPALVVKPIDCPMAVSSVKLA